MQYDADSAEQGKAASKAALQRELGLHVTANIPLVGFVGRLADQKGLDLIADVIQKWTGADLQWVVLGTGEARYHQLFTALAQEYPNKIAARLEFSEGLAHRIEAGADMFLMPSRYEPCGLNQLYSLKYGTVPVVHETGGLADTITDATEDALKQGIANGFVTSEYSPVALANALRRACQAYAQPEIWRRLVSTGMRQDWSWSRSARQYASLYESIISAQRQTVGT
jgi:starch synthase